MDENKLTGLMCLVHISTNGPAIATHCMKLHVGVNNLVPEQFVANGIGHVTIVI
jgi:hypothetical protein